MWVLANVIASLDKRVVPVDVCLSTGSELEPTPMYQAIRTVGGLRLHRVDLGRLADQGTAGRITAAWRWAVAGLRLMAHVRRERIAFVHVADRRVDATVGVVLARLSGARSVVHCNVAAAAWMPRSLRWALRSADALIAVSEFVGRTLTDVGCEATRVHVVANAIDLAAWQPGHGRAEARRELGIGDDEMAVLSVCRLFEAKGPGRLIRACARLRTAHPGLRLVIAGVEGIPHGSYTRDLEALISELDAHGWVRLLGWRDDVGRLMAAADVFAMPSDMEPFGLVYAEAMAMGLPVVALDNGGTPEVVEHGTTGFLSALADDDGLVASLDKLLSDPELRSMMGTAGRARALERDAGNRFGSEIANVYDRVARER